jgi:hypothetical protein
MDAAWGFFLLELNILYWKQQITKYSDFRNNDCRLPTNILTQDCAGKQSCKAFFSVLEMTGCGSQTVFADLLDYKYQCVPCNLNNK